VVILAGVGLFVGVVALYLAIDGLGPYIYGVRLLDGVATAMFYTGLFTYAADLVPASRRTEGLAIFGVSGLLSLALGAQSGDIILAYATYRELFMAAFGLAALGLIACLSLRDVPAEHADRPVPPRHVLVTAAQRDLLSVWIATFAFFVGVLAVFSFMKTYVAATGFSDVGSFFTAYAGVAVALRIFLGWLPERLGERQVLGIAMASYAVGFVVLSMAHSGEYVLAAAFVCGAGHGFAYPVLFSLVVARARPQERGAAAAFFTMLDWLALLVAAPVVGYLIERTGYSATFMTLALLLAMGIAMFYALDRSAGP
jgi:predicted MFS family arabinose efflux permease